MKQFYLPNIDKSFATNTQEVIQEETLTPPETRNDKSRSRHSKIRSKHDKVRSRHEKIRAKHHTVQKEMATVDEDIGDISRVNKEDLMIRRDYSEQKSYQ